MKFPWRTKTSVFSGLGHFGFQLAFASLLLAIIAEAMRPGFVSRYLSFAWLLAWVFLWAILAAREPSLSPKRTIWPFFLAFGLSLSLIVVTWTLGADLGDTRLFLTAAAGLSPLILWRLDRASLD